MTKTSDFRQLQYNFAAHIRDPENNPAPENLEDRRLSIYRDLFFNNQVNFIVNTFPVITSIYGENRIREMVRAFFSTYENHSPYFRQIPKAFLDFIAKHPQDGVHGFFEQLARYEWLELYLMIHEDPEVPEHLISHNDEKLLNSPLLLNSVMLIEHYTYPVQHITAKNADSIEPAETFLILYRNHSNKVCFIAVNSFTAIFWDLIKNNPDMTTKQAIEVLAENFNKTSAELETQIIPLLLKGMKDGMVLGIPITN